MPISKAALDPSAPTPSLITLDTIRISWTRALNLPPSARLQSLRRLIHTLKSLPNTDPTSILTSHFSPLYVDLALTYILLGNTQSAAAAFDHARKSQPGSAIALFGLGLALADLSYWEQASRAFKKCLKCFRNEAEWSDGIVYKLFQGREEGANDNLPRTSSELRDKWTLTPGMVERNIHISKHQCKVTRDKVQAQERSQVLRALDGIPAGIRFGPYWNSEPLSCEPITQQVSSGHKADEADKDPPTSTFEAPKPEQREQPKKRHLGPLSDIGRPRNDRYVPTAPVQHPPEHLASNKPIQDLVEQPAQRQRRRMTVPHVQTDPDDQRPSHLHRSTSHASNAVLSSSEESVAENPMQEQGGRKLQRWFGKLDIPTRQESVPIVSRPAATKQEASTAKKGLLSRALTFPRSKGKGKKSPGQQDESIPLARKGSKSPKQGSVSDQTLANLQKDGLIGPVRERPTPERKNKSLQKMKSLPSQRKKFDERHPPATPHSLQRSMSDLVDKDLPALAPQAPERPPRSPERHAANVPSHYTADTLPIEEKTPHVNTNIAKNVPVLDRYAFPPPPPPCESARRASSSRHSVTFPPDVDKKGLLRPVSVVRRLRTVSTETLYSFPIGSRVASYYVDDSVKDLTKGKGKVENNLYQIINKGLQKDLGTKPSDWMDNDSEIVHHGNNEVEGVDSQILMRYSARTPYGKERNDRLSLEDDYDDSDENDDLMESIQSLAGDDNEEDDADGGPVFRNPFSKQHVYEDIGVELVPPTKFTDVLAPREPSVDWSYILGSFPGDMFLGVSTRYVRELLGLPSPREPQRSARLSRTEVKDEALDYREIEKRRQDDEEQQMGLRNRASEETLLAHPREQSNEDNVEEKQSMKDKEMLEEFLGKSRNPPVRLPKYEYYVRQSRVYVTLGSRSSSPPPRYSSLRGQDLESEDGSFHYRYNQQLIEDKDDQGDEEANHMNVAADLSRNEDVSSLQGIEARYPSGPLLLPRRYGLPESNTEANSVNESPHELPENVDNRGSQLFLLPSIVEEDGAFMDLNFPNQPNDHDHETQHDDAKPLFLQPVALEKSSTEVELQPARLSLVQCYHEMEERRARALHRLPRVFGMYVPGYLQLGNGGDAATDAETHPGSGDDDAAVHADEALMDDMYHDEDDSENLNKNEDETEIAQTKERHASGPMLMPRAWSGHWKRR